MDRSGATVKTPLNGYKNLAPGSVITVKGKVERRGKSVRVKATGFSVG